MWGRGDLNIRAWFVGFFVGVFFATLACAANNCTGATYYDAVNDTCISCPTGYDYDMTDGKTSVAQCRIQCAAGTYVEYSGLDIGYTRLEYIQSSGTQYIDTGVKLNQDSRVEVGWKYYTQSSVSYSGRILGARYTDGTARFMIGTNNGKVDPKTRMLFQFGGAGVDGDYASIGTWLDIVLGGDVHTINGTQYGDGFTVDDFETPYTLKLFAMGQSAPGEAETIDSGIGQCSYLRIYDDNTLIRNLIPARRDSDDAIGMYDTVTGTFFENDGTGVFTAGPDVGGCVNAGAGYWAPGEIVDYGSAGMRTACAAGTYSSVVNASSAATCTTCTGTTYSGVGAAACTSCPAGYTHDTTAGKTSDTQCQVQCNAGTYVENQGITGYTRLDYLESTASPSQAYIDTDRDFNSTYTYEIKFLKTGGNNAIMGARNNSSGYSAKGNFSVSFSSGETAMYSSTSSELNVLRTVRYQQASKTLLFDGTDYWQSAWITSVSIPYNVYLFAINAAGYVIGSRTGAVRIYSYSVWDMNGALIQNLVPVQRNSDGEPGMYDTVSGKFFINRGAGAFTAGPVQAPCADARAGHWVSSSVVNFGAVGTLTACPVGTYLGTTGATSAAACTTCTGTTYSDTPGAAACTPCPVGYTANETAGKTSDTQCQIQCSAGTYVESAVLSGGYRQLEYIQSDGNVVLQTNYTPQGTDVIELQYKLMPAHLSKALDKFLLRTGNTWVETYNATNKWYARFGSSSSANTAFDSETQTEGVLVLRKNSLSVNGTKILTPSYNTAPSGTMRLFGNISSGEPVSTSIMQTSGFKVTRGGVLVFNLVPARRVSDGEIGMYDTVSNTFFTKTGWGSFIAGPDVTGACTDVGTGHWAAASVTNYGSVGTRNACPAGTYSDITNGTSAAACTDCAGTTYNDAPGAAVCSPCPAGYTYNITAGKTSASQCQIHCDAGSYLSDTTGYTRLEYIESNGTQYIDTGVPVNDSLDTTIDFQLTTDAIKWLFGSREYDASDNPYRKYSIQTFSPQYHKLWLQFDNTPDLEYDVITSADTTEKHLMRHTVRLVSGELYLDGTKIYTLNQSLWTPFRSDKTLLLLANRSQQNGIMGAKFIGKIYGAQMRQGGNLVANLVPARRNSDNVVGMYDTVTGTFKENSGTEDAFTAGPDSGVIGGYCTNVGAGYWATDSTVGYGTAGTRNACPAGTTTVGYGHGADSANDCGRTLHVDDYTLYMRRDKVTTPALNIDVGNGNVFYINLSPTNHNISPIHFEYNGNEYTAYDDSLFYGERNVGD